RAAPEPPLFAPSAAPVVDKQRGLTAFESGLLDEQRDADNAGNVQQHRPEQTMGHRVEALQPEQGRGTQQGNAKQALLEQLARQRARRRERWKEQRIGPDQE